MKKCSIFQCFFYLLGQFLTVIYRQREDNTTFLQLSVSCKIKHKIIKSSSAAFGIGVSSISCSVESIAWVSAITVSDEAESMAGAGFCLCIPQT